MTKNVLFEIGLEELPARFIDDAEKQLLEKTTNWLQDLRISFKQITSFSTPRRLAVLIEDMEEVQESIEEEVKGPSEKIAKDAEGNWTKAGIGFTRGQGKTVEDIYLKEIKGVSYIYVKKFIEGKQVKELLPEFKGIVESIQFAKNMRWSTQSMRYARPIRWLVALFGEEVIPFEIATVHTGNQTYGHRFLGNKIELKNPLDYKKVLAEQFVLVDPAERETLILDQIKALEEKENFIIPVDKDLLDEVRNLVEYPTAFIGEFEEAYLNLPSEVLITSMKEHQRYFPVKSKEQTLLSKFIGVRNGDDKFIDNVARGNEKVLRARLADAEFFYQEDQKNTIDFYSDKLERVIFQEKLGTYADKVNRVVSITKEICHVLQLDSETTEKAIRAAEISKFDLMTNMVDEFTELQGVMGEKYALIFGEERQVATAIREHYLPKQANGELPESVIGSILSVADKLDTIVGCISVGLTPTGSQDPYGLRRQALGILRILNEKQWILSLESLLNMANSVYEKTNIEIDNKENINNALYDFFQLRVSYLLKEINIESDIIHAVTENGIGVVDFTRKKARLLSQKRNDPSFKQIEEALVRVLNLAKDTEQHVVNPEIFETESEKDLFLAYESLVHPYQEAMKELDAEKALAELSKLADPIHHFFEHNMVMADNQEVRNNRLALLVQIANSIKEYADLSKIEWKQHQ